jgi:multidrug resistance efflux pump
MKPRLFAREQAEDDVLLEPAPARSFTPSRAVQSDVPRGAPLPNRPKGRLLVAGVLVLTLGLVAVGAWDAFFRYDAYGTVAGRVIEIAPPWAGTVETVHVRPGDQVQQGDVIATIQSLEVEGLVGRWTDELRVAEAELDAEVARVALDAQNRDDRRQQALADYYALSADLLAERSREDDLQSKLVRATELMERNALAGQEFDSVRFTEMGQRAKIEQLQLALDELKRRVDAGERPLGEEQRLKPKLARIEQVQAEVHRLREKLRLGTIRAPVDGRIIALHHHAGEYLEQGAPIVELLCEGSVELLIYARQESADAYSLGAVVDVIVPPRGGVLRCRVVRIGDEYQGAPRSLETRYRHGEKLLPVYLDPAPSFRSAAVLRLGSEVRVPCSWNLLRKRNG